MSELIRRNGEKTVENVSPVRRLNSQTDFGKQ